MTTVANRCRHCGAAIVSGAFCSQGCSDAMARAWARPCEVCGVHMTDPRSTAPTSFSPFCSRDCWGGYHTQHYRKPITVWCIDPSHSKAAPEDSASLENAFAGGSAVARFHHELLCGDERGLTMRLAPHWVFDDIDARQPFYLPQSGRRCAKGHAMTSTPIGDHGSEHVCPECGERATVGNGPATWLPVRADRVVSFIDGTTLTVQCPCGQSVRSSLTHFQHDLTRIDAALPGEDRRVSLTVWRAVAASPVL